MVAVGVGNNVRERELYGIASHPVEGSTFRVENFDSFATITDSILDAICNSK